MLVKNRVKNSQLDSQKEMLDNEQKLLDGANRLLNTENSRLDKENTALTKTITEAIQRIDINNLLKDIDIEEYKLIARNNQMMNENLSRMVLRW